MMSSRYVLAFAAVLAAGGCMVGPDYKRPPPADPPSLAFKETTGPVVGAAASFQPAMPRDAIDRGPWWTMYDDRDARPAGGADRHLQPDADAGRSRLSPGARAGSPGCLGPLSRRSPAAAGYTQSGSGSGSSRAIQGTVVNASSGSVGQFSVGAGAQLGDRPVGPHPPPDRERFGGGPGLRPPTSPMRGCRRRPTWRSTISRMRISEQRMRLYQASVAAYTRSVEIVQNQLDAGIVEPRRPRPGADPARADARPAGRREHHPRHRSSMPSPCWPARRRPSSASSPGRLPPDGADRRRPASPRRCSSGGPTSPRPNARWRRPTPRSAWPSPPTIPASRSPAPSPWSAAA